MVAWDRDQAGGRNQGYCGSWVYDPVLHGIIADLGDRLRAGPIYGALLLRAGPVYRALLRAVQGVSPFHFLAVLLSVRSRLAATPAWLARAVRPCPCDVPLPAAQPPSQHGAVVAWDRDQVGGSNQDNHLVLLLTMNSNPYPRTKESTFCIKPNQNSTSRPQSTFAVAFHECKLTGPRPGLISPGAVPRDDSVPWSKLR